LSVSGNDALRPWNAAVIEAVFGPIATVVTSPVEFTIAAAVFEDCQVTPLAGTALLPSE